MNRAWFDRLSTYLGRLRSAESGMSMIEVALAAAIVVFAIVAVLRMFAESSTDVLNNKVRQIAQTEAVYGVEHVKAIPFDSIPTSPAHQYVTDTFTHDNIGFTRVIHYMITDSNHDGMTDSADYIVAKVSVWWDSSNPADPIEMTVIKSP